MIYLGNSPVGVGLASVGELTKHQQIKVTPSETAQLSVSHNLGVVPKLVTIRSNQSYESITFVYHGVFSEECGCTMSLTSDGKGAPNAYIVLLNTTGTSNSYAYFNMDAVVIRRSNSARYFSTTTEYTVDIYA